MPAQKLIVINAVGLTPALLAHAPRLRAHAKANGLTPLYDVLPAVTCTAQATMLTGKSPQEHGIVANGWHFRDTQEVRFWQQANSLLQAEPIYAKLKKQNPGFRCAKLFWWFNQGADASYSVTPKPHYGIDGSKVFGITGTPESFPQQLEQALGPFPFHTFWGPKAGLPCTQWIAKSAVWTLQNLKPDLTLVYLPHLDYEPQRQGPAGCDMARFVQELDDACGLILDAAKTQGARVLVVSEYGHCDVSRPIMINRALREAGLLQVRKGPFGEQLDIFNSRAYAVCDHQLAHISVKNPADIEAVVKLVQALPGVDKLYIGTQRAEIQLDHPRSGEVIALGDGDSWFAYPFWLDDALAPDYARCVAIHHKPGYDPAELFLDPAIRFPILKIVRKLIRKKLGFRMKMDVIPLNANLVHGSHGRPSATAETGPLLIGAGDGQRRPMSDMHSVIEEHFQNL
jgi:predicted AlkP superfamily pyrophosphatase or phosphodiesterase